MSAFRERVYSCRHSDWKPETENVEWSRLEIRSFGPFHSATPSVQSSPARAKRCDNSGTSSLRREVQLCFRLHNETIRFVDNGLASYEYMLVNPQWVYPYKVNYDLDNWRLLVDQLHRDHEEIPTLSRMQLLVDADTYLKQSAVPQLYIRLLWYCLQLLSSVCEVVLCSYLVKEADMGILLVGLDAVHSLVDTFSGTSIVSALISHFVPVIQRIEWALVNTGNDPELAATWLLSPRRLLKLYQLRCAANLESCERQQQVWERKEHTNVPNTML